MGGLDGQAIRDALARLGQALAAPVDLFVVGGSAGLLSGELGGSRTTGDCDVVQVDPAGAWSEVQRGALEVARGLGLPDAWLNRDSRHFKHLLALGWRERCGVEEFGRVRVHYLSRPDLIAAKVAAGRPQDFDDLVALRPSAEERAFAHAHLDRLEQEALGGDSYDANRSLLDSLG
ncbi:MAG: DUF6036 family nucleotidyltransferase [Planctomycetota bacterium]